MNKQAEIKPIGPNEALRLYKMCERWPKITGVEFAELHVSPQWIDLCWWNGTAWQYITTRKQ